MRNRRRSARAKSPLSQAGSVGRPERRSCPHTVVARSPVKRRQHVGKWRKIKRRSSEKARLLHQRLKHGIRRIFVKLHTDPCPKFFSPPCAPRNLTQVGPPPSPSAQVHVARRPTAVVSRSSLARPLNKWPLLPFASLGRLGRLLNEPPTSTSRSVGSGLNRSRHGSRGPRAIEGGLDLAVADEVEAGAKLKDVGDQRAAELLLMCRRHSCGEARLRIANVPTPPPQGACAS